LVSHGFLVKVSSQWTEAVYRLNEGNRGDAEQFITESKKGKRKSR
jgi:hypothetical protein